MNLRRALLPLVGLAQNTAVDEAGLRENLAWQIALEGVGFSPGLLDGSVGEPTGRAGAHRAYTREPRRLAPRPAAWWRPPSTAA